jgi:hypothetical protein
MPGQLLQDTPTATQANASPGDPAQPGDGEEAASPYEEHLLAKVMAAVYKSLNAPAKMRQMEGWMLHSPNLGSTIGNIAFTILASIYQGAKKAGVMIPVDVFFAQGGAVYQTIDRIIMIAEHAGVPDPDPDKLREESMGVLSDKVRHMFMADEHAPQQSAPGPVPPGQAPVMAGNPMSQAVGQGLQQQGLMAGAGPEGPPQ